MSAHLCSRPSPRHAFQGLTLLELVVVMAILAALAGLIVPLLPNMIIKAHTSAGASNLGEITKALQMYAARKGDNLPDNFDNLVPTGSTTIATFVPNNAGALTVGTLTEDELDALDNVGIANVVCLAEDTNIRLGASSWSPTNYPYAAVNSTTGRPASTALSTSTSVAFVLPTAVSQRFGLSPYGHYVAFGVGKYCTLVGEGMDGAPIWYSPVEGYDPASMYARFGVIFQVAEGTSTTNSEGETTTTYTALSKAKFVGTVEFGPWGVMTKDNNLDYYYQQK